MFYFFQSSKSLLIPTVSVETAALLMKVSEDLLDLFTHAQSGAVLNALSCKALLNANSKSALFSIFPSRPA